MTRDGPTSPRPCQSLSRLLSHNPRRAGWPPLAPLIPRTPHCSRCPDCVVLGVTPARRGQAVSSCLQPARALQRSVSGGPQLDAHCKPAASLTWHSHCPQRSLVLGKTFRTTQPPLPAPSSQPLGSCASHWPLGSGHPGALQPLRGEHPKAEALSTSRKGPTPGDPL